MKQKGKASAHQRAYGLRRISPSAMKEWSMLTMEPANRVISIQRSIFLVKRLISVRIIKMKESL